MPEWTRDRVLSQSLHCLEPTLSYLRDTRREQFKEEVVRALGMVKVCMEKIQTGQMLLAKALARAALQLVRQSPEYKRRALHYLKHSWKVYSLSRALAKALEDSREASSWPGDRLQVGSYMSERVEKVTRLIQREAKTYAASWPKKAVRAA
jgi:hypothetical protein